MNIRWSLSQTVQLCRRCSWADGAAVQTVQLRASGSLSSPGVRTKIHASDNSPESRVGAQRQSSKVRVVIQVDGWHTGGQDVNHSHSHNFPIKPVLLVEGAVSHLRTIRRKLCLQKRKTIWSENVEFMTQISTFFLWSPPSNIYIHTPVGWFIITLFPVGPHALGVGVYSSLTFSIANGSQMWNESCSEEEEERGGGGGAARLAKRPQKQGRTFLIKEPQEQIQFLHAGMDCGQASSCSSSQECSAAFQSVQLTRYSSI